MLINQQIDSHIVPNPIEQYPSMSTADLIDLMRIDKSLGTARIVGYIRDAYDTINVELASAGLFVHVAAVTPTCVWEHAPAQVSHHHRLQARTPQSSLPAVACTATSDAGFLFYENSSWRRTYLRAVMNEAAALMCDEHADFDTIGQGYTRANNERTKSDRLRRIVSHCLADLTGRTRNRVRLL